MVKVITKKEQIKLDEMNYLLGLYDIDLPTLKDILVERHIIQDEMEKARKLVSKLIKKQDELESRYNSISGNIASKDNKKKETDDIKMKLEEFLNTQEEVNI